MANVHDWATTPAPITLAGDTYHITPMVSARSIHGTTYTLHVKDRDGASLGYFFGVTPLDGEELDAAYLAKILRYWYHNVDTLTTGHRLTLSNMQQRSPARFSDLIH